jgi:sugar lactone lactonase YvrE
VSLDGGAVTEIVRLERCVPDGMALDDAGGLFVCCYQPNQLWDWSPDGRLDLVFDDWTGEYILSPTNIAFFGDDLSDLALASLCGHDLVTIRPPGRGVDLHYPLLDADETGAS